MRPQKDAGSRRKSARDARTFSFFGSFQANNGSLGNEFINMKTSKLLTAIAVSAALALGVAQAKEKKHDEESIKTSDVPAAVQKAAETEAKGGKIVRWEKEGGNYE